MRFIATFFILCALLKTSFQEDEQSDENNEETTTTTTTPTSEGVTLKDFGDEYITCDGNDFCNNNGNCKVNVNNLTDRVCSCHQHWAGVYCETKTNVKKKIEVMKETYIVYVIAIIAGLLVIALLALTFRCYKKHEAEKQKRKWSKNLEKEEEQRKTSNILGLNYTNPGFEHEYPRSFSQTSIGSGSKSDTKSNRVFHLNLGKGKSNSDHVIVEVDNDDSADSGRASSEKEADFDDVSDIFPNDQVTVTSGSSSSDSPIPTRKQNTDEIIDEYTLKKMNFEKQRRNSADFDAVNENYNPFLYYTAPNRGKDKNRRPNAYKNPNISSGYNTQGRNQGANHRARKHSSEDILRTHYHAKQQRMRNMRSHSLGDLTDVGLESNSFGSSQSYLDLSHDYDARLTNQPPGYATFSKNKGNRGIWAKTNERR